MNSNIVLTIPEEKLEDITNYLSSYKMPTDNKYLILSAKKSEVTFNLFKTGKLVLQGNNKVKLEQEKDSVLSKIFSGKEDLILGIDEVGRSEIVGPYVIGAVLGYDKDLIECRDSKKTNDIPKAKEIVDKKALGVITLSINPKLIDELRENGVNLNEMENIFAKNVMLMFKEMNLQFTGIIDGEVSKTVPGFEYKIKADDKVPVVGSASIIAKNTRDLSKNKDVRLSWNVKSNKD